MKITALDSFAHGAKQYVAGDEVQASKGEAEDMVNRGIAQYVTEDVAPQTGVTDSQPAEDDLEDLVGGKAEEAPLNKMESAPANKAAKAKK